MPTKPSRFLFFLFGTLYFVQGAITSYQLNFFKPHMSSVGISADLIAIVASLALLPFILKGFLGLLSDRVNFFGLGHRVPYMMLGIVICIVAFSGAYFVDPSENFTILASMVLLATTAMAFFDTTADAFAVEVMPPEEHSRVQSVMTGGRAAGLIILSFVFGLLAERFGFSVTFLVIAVCMLLPLFMLFRVKEASLRKETHSFSWRAFGMMLKPSNLLFAVFLIGAWFTFQGIDGLVTFYMSSQLNASETTLGTYGTFKGIGMVLGALTMLAVSSRLGKRTAGLLTLSLVTILGLIISVTTNVNTLLILGVFWGIVAGLHWTIHAAIAMGITDLRIAATMFALFQTMSNIGLALGEGIATGLSDDLGFARVFQLLALSNIIMIPLLIWVFQMFIRAKVNVD